MQQREGEEEGQRSEKISDPGRERNHKGSEGFKCKKTNRWFCYGNNSKSSKEQKTKRDSVVSSTVQTRAISSL